MPMGNDKIKLCECGCGKSVTQRRDGSYNDFINHHHIRVKNPAKSPEFIKRMTGENNPSKRPEVKDKISKSLKGVYSGEKNHMKKEKYRKLFSEMHKGENNPMYGRNYPEQSERMKKNNPMLNPKIRPKSLQHRKKISQARKLKCGIEEGHKLWDEFLTPISEKIRKLIEYKLWRSNIYERDSYTCQNCGDKTGGNLNVHHIKYFNEIIINNNIDTLEKAKSCNDLWKIENGITLCNKCHREIHSKPS